MNELDIKKKVNKIGYRLITIAFLMIATTIAYVAFTVYIPLGIIVIALVLGLIGYLIISGNNSK